MAQNRDTIFNPPVQYIIKNKSYYDQDKSEDAFGLYGVNTSVVVIHLFIDDHINQWCSLHGSAAKDVYLLYTMESMTTMEWECIQVCKSNGIDLWRLKIPRKLHVL